MRLWDKTAFFIRLIQETLRDAMYFLLVYGLIIFAFAVALFMLNQNRGYGSENSIYDELTGFETADAAIATYMQSLGDFSTDSYNSGDNPHMIWLFFIVTTFLTSITILNMLIAVMGDTFGRETEIKERQILRERMVFSSEFTFLFASSKNFNFKEKYLFCVRPAPSEEVSSTEMLIESLREKIETLEQSMGEKSDQNKDIVVNKVQILEDKITSMESNI
jgi:hypothetical protein